MAKTYRSLTLDATVDNLAQVTDFLDAWLEEIDCPLKARMQLAVVVEEVFVNIASYAYAPAVGRATVRFSFSENPARVSVTFYDHGRPFDPLEKEDPNVSLSAEEREIGGLGIFMTKKLMDDVRYEYRNGKNILRLRKDLSP